MPYRSITRIRRNQNTENNFNILAFICTFFLFNIIFYQYWYFVNSLFLLILIFFCYQFRKQNDRQNDRQYQRQIPIVIAEPILPYNDSNQIVVTATIL